MTINEIQNNILVCSFFFPGNHTLSHLFNFFICWATPKIKLVWWSNMFGAIIMRRSKLFKLFPYCVPFSNLCNVSGYTSCYIPANLTTLSHSHPSGFPSVPHPFFIADPFLSCPNNSSLCSSLWQSLHIDSRLSNDLFHAFLSLW